MFDNRYVNEAGTSGCKQQLLGMRASPSNHVVVEKSSRNLWGEDSSRRRKAEIKYLEGRLRVVKEEVEMLKKALLEGVEERAKMMHDTHEDFKTVQHFQFQRELEIGELYARQVQIVSLFKDRRAGLLQILCQESNP